VLGGGGRRRISLASYNTHASLDHDWRTFDLVTECRALDTDVLVLQEVWQPVGPGGGAERVAGELGYQAVTLDLARVWRIDDAPAASRRHRRGRHSLPALRFGPPDGWRAPSPGAAGALYRPGNWQVAVLSRLPLLSSETIDLGTLARDPARRGAIVTRLDIGGGELAVVGTHLSHVTHGSILQLLRLRRRLPGRRVAAAFAGDMNLWGPPLSAMLPGWRRAVRGRTWPARFPLAQLDHILVTPVVEVTSAEIVALRGSDHRAVRVSLSVPLDAFP
jgi:endonuclease/exonuclease/phosphatase family metal-dependent hydrolase